MKQFFVLVMIAALCFPGLPATAQVPDDPARPDGPVKLIFIHHSTGENWLRDDYGGLGLALAQNNYFVSDTNYGWGPEAVGDRTDIINWSEWFRSSQTDVIMGAVYTESGQNSAYTRSFADPGGENEIVVFKSCFPNSQIEGGPDDPASEGEGLTVSNAKFIYNDLLNYFRLHPDKLFIVITAPPVQDSTYAANARLFSTWLTQDWLQENNYPYPNVAVFDFHDVLTHRDNHHQYTDVGIEYITSHGDGTSAYASGRDDDHPNEAGSRKATTEFVPLLNVFYHRWKASSESLPTEPVLDTGSPTEAPVATLEVKTSTQQTSLIDDFETGAPAQSTGWTAFWDGATHTQIDCQVDSGSVHAGQAALHAAFTVEAGSWATCALEYDPARSETDSVGISFYLKAAQPGLVFDLLVYGGTPGEKTTFVKVLETGQGMGDGWQQVQVPWSELLRADWEADAGRPYQPTQVTGLGFGFNGGAEQDLAGEIWVDDIRLLVSGDQVDMPVIEAEPTASLEMLEPEVQAASTEAPAAATQAGKGRSPLPCTGSLGAGFLVVSGAILARKRRKLH